MNNTLKILLVALIAVPLLILILAQLGLFSSKAPEGLGVSKNRLKPPSKYENSVSSQADFYQKTGANVEYAKIAPFNYKGHGQDAMTKLKELIAADFKEARLIEEKNDYLRYEFSTGLMKFTDDVEFFLDQGENYIHFRSASRLGRKDFGKNRHRMEEIRTKFQEINK